MGILARLRLAKIRTMARPNSPDMPPKRTKKVRLGIFSVHFHDFDMLLNEKHEWGRDIVVHRINNVHINTSQIKTINCYIYQRIRLCIGHELCQIKYFLYYYYFIFQVRGGTDLHYSFVLFLDDISFIFTPGMTILMLGWLACPAWILSLCIFFHHAGHEHSVWARVALSFGKWGVWYKRETILMSMKQFFSCLCCLYFSWWTCTLYFHAHAISNAS